MTTRKNPIDKKPITKVIATINVIENEPDYMYMVKCPYCNHKKNDEVFEGNCTIKVRCFNCDKDFKVKIPKFY